MEIIFRPREILTQQDNQSCLLSCLQMAYSTIAQGPIDYHSIEKELHNDSFGLYPRNFALSRSAAFTRMFPNIGLNIFVDNQMLTSVLKKLNSEGSISISNQPITADWIIGMLTRPMIVYVDQLHLGVDAHMPHFVYLYKADENNVHMVDPAFGEDKILQPETLQHALMGLKYQMLWSPLAITMEEL